MGGRAWTSQVSRCKLTEPGRARARGMCRVSRPRARSPGGRAATVASLRASLPPPEGMVAAETGAPRASPRDATRTRYRSNTTIEDVGCPMYASGSPPIARRTHIAARTAHRARPAGVPAAARVTRAGRRPFLYRTGAIPECAKTDDKTLETRIVGWRLLAYRPLLPHAREGQPLCCRSRFGARNVRCADPPP